MTALALVDRLRALPAEDRRAILGRCSARELAALRWCWREFWARPDSRTPGNVNGTGQLPPPGDWTWWGQIGGRGSGKTESGSRWTQAEAERLGAGCIFHLVGANVDDARATMIEGPSGLLQAAPPWARPVYQPSVKGGTLTWPNGAVARLFGADKPSKGRGPQCNRMWVDDPAAFGPHGKDVLDQLLFGFRIRAPDGSPPRGTVTSTPIDSELLAFFLSGEDGQRRSRIVYSRSITDDNRANLSEEFFEQTLAEFAGTELERQERYGELVAGTERTFRGFDFTKDPIRVGAAPELRKIGIGIDPSTSGGAHACEVGIIVGGIDAQAHTYALEDLSRVATTADWPRVVVEAAARWDADFIVVESNKGTSWAEDLLHGAEKLRRAELGEPMLSRLTVIPVRADEVKGARAGRLVPLYRQGMVHHVAGLGELERQLVKLDGTKEQKGVDRADGWVHVATELTGGRKTARSDGKPKAPVKGPPPVESMTVRGKSWTTF
jgi:phage terminase large subunit-like protein